MLSNFSSSLTNHQMFSPDGNMRPSETHRYLQYSTDLSLFQTAGNILYNVISQLSKIHNNKDLVFLDSLARSVCEQSVSHVWDTNRKKSSKKTVHAEV